MSMPAFPETGADITQEQAFNMLLASIAMEELALSHIMNAEGEKLQYVLGTLPGGHRVCTSTQELLDVNKSITNLLDTVMQNQVMLKGKLERVLDAKERHCPAPPPPPAQECHFAPCACWRPAGQEYLKLCAAKPGCLWKAGCRLSWQCTGKCGGGMAWSNSDPFSTYLYPGRNYLISVGLRYGMGLGAAVRVALETAENGRVRPVQCFESREGDLSGNAVLPVCGGCAVPVSLVLKSPAEIRVEQADLVAVPLGTA